MRRLLVDSHTFLWFVHGDGRLSPPARKAIEGSDEVWLSHASVWELTIKHAAGRLTLAAPLREMATRGGFLLLPVDLAHIEATARLPRHHRDPFDRMLVAQAIEEGMTLVTGDDTLWKYPVAWLW